MRNKNFVRSIIILAIVQVSISPTFAANSVTSTSSVKVESNVTSEGTSTIYKKVDVTVNGQREVVESHEAGTDTIEVTSTNGTTTVKKSSSKTATKVITSTPAISITPIPTDTTEKIVESAVANAERISLGEWIRSSLASFFKKLFGK